MLSVLNVVPTGITVDGHNVRGGMTLLAEMTHQYAVAVGAKNRTSAFSMHWIEVFALT